MSIMIYHITIKIISPKQTEGNKMVGRNGTGLMEIKTLLENLQPKEPMIFDTTHPTNIISIKGTLPQDRERLIGEIMNY